jgi:hypothetical protein
MNKAQIIEREARIGPFAGAAGFAGAILFAVSLFLVSGSDFGKADTSAERLLALHADSAQFVIAQVLQAIALLLFAVVVITLFRAASARDSNVYRGILGFAFIGPGLYAISIVMTTAGFIGAADDYAALPPPDVGSAAQLSELKSAIADDPGSISKILLLTDADVAEYNRDDTITSVAYPDEEEGDLQDSADAADITVETDDVAEPGELAAEQVVDDNSLHSTAGGLLLPAALALIVITFYTARIAMRTGLQTQFWGTFGMAAGIATIFLGPVGPFIWAVNAGLVSSGWAQRRPPAWEAGKAVPWAGPGGAASKEPGEEEAASPEDFEGSATDVSERPGRRDNKRKRKRKAR